MVAPSTPAHRVCQYHNPDEDGIARIGKIRAATQHLIETIVDNCPPSPDRGAALRHARETMMSANASIVVPQEDVVALGREPMVEAEDLDDADRPF